MSRWKNRESQGIDLSDVCPSRAFHYCSALTRRAGPQLSLTFPRDQLSSQQARLLRLDRMVRAGLFQSGRRRVFRRPRIRVEARLENESALSQTPLREKAALVCLLA